jgi:hypothetical protein
VTDTPVTDDADLPRELRNVAPYPKPDDPLRVTVVIAEEGLDANPINALIYCMLRQKAPECIVASSFSPMQGLTTLTGFEPVLPP